MSQKRSSLMPGGVENLRRRSVAEAPEHCVDPEHHFQFPQRHFQSDRLCAGSQHPEMGTVETPPPDSSTHHFCHCTPKCFLTVPHRDNCVDHDQHHQFPRRQSQTDRLCVGPQHPEIGTVEISSPDVSARHFCHNVPKCYLTVPHRGQAISGWSTSSRYGEDGWHEGTTKTTVKVDNEVEAHREANNYKFGFRKWKGNVTEKPIEDQSDTIKELHSDLSIVKSHEGSVVTFGNIVYVFLFGWWISLIYFVICPVMFLTIFGAPYGKLCLKMAWFFFWPFGKLVEKSSDLVMKSGVKPPKFDVIPEVGDNEDSKDLLSVKESAPLLVSSPMFPSPVEIPVPELPARKRSKHWCRISTYVWLLLGYPVLVVVHSLVCIISWLLVFTIPVAKMNARTLSTVLLMAPEDVNIHTVEKISGCKTRVILCCYQAFNAYYYKYTLQGINIFGLNLLPLVLATLVIGYTDYDHKYFSPEVKFATAITSIIPLSYYIGMGIASISAQSNFALGAVVNATFGSITELTFYITALLQGHRLANKCYEEVVKAALTGTLLGCILFIPGVCMIVGGIKHREQKFNSRSAGVSSALLFISIGGVFAPTLFSKTFGNLMCENCTNVSGNATVPFVCKGCHYDMTQTDPHLILSHIEPLVYTISVLLPAAYIIGLIFTLKTHSHIYDIQISDDHRDHAHGHHVVHWSRWRALGVLIVATVLMACCADLSTTNIEPMLTNYSISQYFIGVTVLAMVPELPEIVNGVQFALQNNISLSLEVGSCIAVQVCMIQIPLLILFNVFFDVGFVLLFSDIHLWASIFSVILVNYIFMDGKCDYFQGTALVVVYLILLALYFFAPSPKSC
ncbi:cation/H+ exchanger protein 1 isoform X2 [Anabas testudineus]|uniref:cation/H+ exchanger protein 1 isoform X2 n=1 Tax=Anabas testudineus TaxID=64144 RepID=UPI000E45F06F|nr:cation/H+ exchanger protein 1 isoform X2 [Anabas testudineus]